MAVRSALKLETGYCVSYLDIAFQNGKRAASFPFAELLHTCFFKREHSASRLKSQFSSLKSVFFSSLLAYSILVSVFQPHLPSGSTSSMASRHLFTASFSVSFSILSGGLKYSTSPMGRRTSPFSMAFRKICQPVLFPEPGASLSSGLLPVRWH